MKPLSLLIPVLALALVSCGGGDEQPPPGLTAEEVLSSATAAVQSVSTFHFRLTHENGATPMPLNLELSTAEGDVVTPDRLAAEVSARAGSISVNLDVIAIGDQTWITNPFTRRWQTLPGATIQDVADPASLITSLMQALQEPEVRGQSEMDGVPAYHVAGRIDSGALEASLPIAHAGLPVLIELWIGVPDSLPRRARIIGPIADDDPEGIVRQVDFSRYNARVEIRPPE